MNVKRIGINITFKLLESYKKEQEEIIKELNEEGLTNDKIRNYQKNEKWSGTKNNLIFDKPIN